MPSYRLLALDIDGTLVNSRDELTAPTKEALLRAAAAGLRIVLATGRRYSRTLPLVAPLQLDLPLITSSGALIKRPADHHTLYRAQFERELLCDVLALLDGLGYSAVLYGDTYHDGFDFYRAPGDSGSAELADYLAQNAGCDRTWPGLMTNPPEGIFAGFATGGRDEMLRLQARLDRAFPGRLYLHVGRSYRYLGHMCEIAPAGNTKWSGILRLAREWEIADEEICAVGDDINDIPMLHGAGLGVAMGNALEEVKAVADRIAPGHDEDGLVHVVGWLLG